MNIAHKALIGNQKLLVLRKVGRKFWKSRTFFTIGRIPGVNPLK